jgi:CheY-like chemotaxis protein
MRSILLVDDDDDDRSLFKEAVNVLDKSIQCWTAVDGQQALDVLMLELVMTPDVIFLDLNMPKMNGMEFLKMIKSHRSFKKIPVIIYSTSSNPDDIRKTKELGATDFVTKPSDFDELYQKLILVLNKHLTPSYHDNY